MQKEEKKKRKRRMIGYKETLVSLPEIFLNVQLPNALVV